MPKKHLKRKSRLGGGGAHQKCSRRELQKTRRRPQKKESWAALPKLAGRILMLILGPIAGRTCRRRGPHLAREVALLTPLIK